MSQTFDMTRLIVMPTRHPNTTSATLWSPCLMPIAEESEVMAAAMTTAAVMGACRHIVLIRMTYDETSTVAARASGRIQSSVPPRRRNTSPAALPTATFIKRHLNRRRASSGSGSEAATMDAMAQIGLRSPIACRTFQTIVVASATLMAKRSPTRCSDDSPNRFRSASTRALRDGASSLVRRGSIAMQPVHDAGLRGVQRNPVLRGVLKRYEERLELLHRVQAQLRAILESDLEGEFADQGAVLSAGAPDCDVRFRANPLAKGQHADVLKDFLDNRVAHERDLFA